MTIISRLARALGVTIVIALGVANGQLYAGDDCYKYCGYNLELGSGIRNGCASGCYWTCCEGAYVECASYTYPNCNDDCYRWIPCD